MALKIIRGINHLNAVPARIRLATVIVLAIIGIIIIMPSGYGISSIVKPNQSSTKSEKSLQADRILTNTNARSGKKTAKIVTCPRCRLNALPLVKKFVYEHAKLFEPNLKIDFILGEDPVLHLYENGKELETIDLEEYDSKKIIRKLVQFGINPSTQADVIREALGMQ